MLQHIILLTGMSGAGKTSAMNTLEDLGYFCIDNFPKELLPQLDQLLDEHSAYPQLALAMSCDQFMDFYTFFHQKEVKLTLLFLDASDEQLLLRYRFTRRQHPLIASQQAASLEEAIEIERDHFQSLIQLASHATRIDTTKLKTGQLGKLVARYAKPDQSTHFSVTFQSFGFKHGMPLDADLVVDVRFLANPYYVSELANLTGNDLPVYDYVMKDEATQAFIQVLLPYIDHVLTTYMNQQRAHVNIAIGCTGGQHRSVSVANFLYHHFENKMTSYVSHRDIEGL